MLYNNWSMYLTQVLACNGRFKDTTLTLMSGELPDFSLSWGEPTMAQLLNERRADWVAHYALTDTYAYRVDNTAGVTQEPIWGVDAGDLYGSDFDRDVDYMRIHLAASALLHGNPDWLNGTRSQPEWFVITKDGYGNTPTHVSGANISMIGQVTLLSTETGTGGGLCLSYSPALGEFPTVESIIPFTVPIAG